MNIELPKDAERREVAENLRHLVTDHHIRYNELAEAVVGFEDFHGFEDLLEKLADLIDPEGGGDDYR